MPSVAPSERLAIALDHDAVDNSAFISSVLQSINGVLKADGPDGKGRYPLRASAIARFLRHFALGLNDAVRQGSSDALSPAWGRLAELYKEFAQAVPHLTGAIQPNIDLTLSDDDFSKFCGYATRRRGSQKRLFYAGLALFAVDLVDTGKLKALDQAFVDFVTPEGERDLVPRLRSLFLRALQTRRVPTLEVGPREYPLVRVGYRVQPNNFAKLQAFVDNFKSAHDGGAHFICYRPRHGHPNVLIKSFLAIQPPEQVGDGEDEDSRSYGFVHVYQMPTVGKQQRISLGKVLPLEHGLCLVGGQRPMRPEKIKSEPFHNLKIITVPWHVITHREQLFGGLVLSANYEGAHVVSRVAIRATAIHHSSLLGRRLDAIPIDGLAPDLEDDREMEATLSSPEDAERFRFSSGEAAERIAKLCNNHPFEWEQPHCSAAPTKHPFDGQSLHYWDTLRYGPLISEE